MNCNRFFFCDKRRVFYLLAFIWLFTYIQSDLLLAFAGDKNISEYIINENVIQEMDTEEIGDENIVIETSSLSEEILSKSCVLMEATTGKVLFEKDMNALLSPASITKIMTLVLIFEAIESGEISYSDEVITSAYAKSMGGSQVFLEEGEKQSVETLIKCIVVASGNDASVAMAEYVEGSEEKFVERMNEKAKELGMLNTHFEDCCGLSDSDNHYTSAYDVAIMSRYLITNYPEVYKYSSIWMENITHITDKGQSEFGLSNTNKLLKQYQYTTGLKTGSTSKAKYCVAATAKKGDVELIAVIMAAPDYKIRFKEAKGLLEYGFGVCKLYRDTNLDIKEYMAVKGGKREQIKVMGEKVFTYVSTEEEDFSNIKKDIIYHKKNVAPIKKGDVVGEIIYYIDDKEIGQVDIISCDNVQKANYVYRLKQLFYKFIL